MKITFLMGIEVLRDLKEVITIAVIVVVIKSLIYIKQTAKLNFKLLLLNALISLLLGGGAGLITLMIPWEAWKVMLTTALFTFIGSKIDVYIYKAIDIGFNVAKSKFEDIGKGE